jgi:hypothetical protein
VYFVWKNTILRQKILFFPIAEGGAKNFEVFRVKNHDFTPKNLIFSNFRGGGGRRVRPLDPPLKWLACCPLASALDHEQTMVSKSYDKIY